MLIRGSGIGAFALLSASTIWGLLVSSKLLGRLVKAKPLTWFHESLGIGALIATAVHIVVISIDDFVAFSWEEILIPGRSDWHPYPIAFVIAAFYGLIVVAGSFYVKKWIGHRAWRAVHFASFGIFVSSLLHGILAGTDTLTPVMLGLYLGSSLIVFAISIDDFVISQFLIAGADTVTIPVKLYSGARLAPPPSLNALATVLMVTTIGAVVIAGLLFRALGKRGGEEGSALESVAGFEL